jgi:ribosome-associated protein
MSETERFITITPAVSLDTRELEFVFIRSAGPGGQNVNKVATAVQLRFDAANSPSLTHAVRRRAIMLAGKRATNDGVIIIAAQRHRTQEMNRKDAVERLVELIRAATHVPKKRIATRVTRGSKERRLETKKKRSTTKQHRRVEWD